MRPELAQAIALLTSKDSARINEKIALLQNTVYSFSMKVCGHQEDAEDTMQEVLYKSLPHLAKLEIPALWPSGSTLSLATSAAWLDARASSLLRRQ